MLFYISCGDVTYLNIYRNMLGLIMNIIIPQLLFFDVRLSWKKHYVSSSFPAIRPKKLSKVKLNFADL